MFAFPYTQAAKLRCQNGYLIDADPSDEDRDLGTITLHLLEDSVVDTFLETTFKKTMIHRTNIDMFILDEQRQTTGEKAFISLRGHARGRNGKPHIIYTR